MLKNKTKNIEILVLLSLFFIGFLISLFSPLNPIHDAFFLKGDSSVFAYIGKAMHEYDQIPYLDLFDHKGPLLYFINYFGYTIAGLNGIWAIELVFLLLSIFFIFKTSHLLSKNNFISWLTTFILLLYFAEYNIGGNLTESYAFTFITGSLYFFTDYFIANPEKLPKGKILLIGLFFGAVLMLRPNMIGVWIGFLLVIGIQFLKEKAFKKVFQSILFFGLGTLIAIIPFMLYLYLNNALQAFIFSYWSINRYYTLVSLIDILLNIKYFSLITPFIFIAFLAYIYIITNGAASKSNTKKGSLALGYLLSLLFSIPLMAMSGRDYDHYAIILLPTLIYGIAFTFSTLFTPIQERMNNSKIASSISITSIILILGFYSFTTVNYLKKSLAPISGVPEISTYIQNNSANDDTIIFIGDGNSIYLTADRQAASKYFYQRPVVNVTNGVIKSKDFLNDLETNQPKFIIIQNKLNLSSFFEWDIYEYLNEKIDNGVYEIVEKDTFNKDIIVYIRTE